MSWNCKLSDIVGTRELKWTPPAGGGMCGETLLVDRTGVEYRFRELPVGAMFYLPPNANMEHWPWYNANVDDLSDFYKQNNASRPPIFVILPGHNLFVVDGKCWDHGRKYGGWQVSGEAPNITVNPSIDLKGFYHGYLANGIIGDDVEGRIFDQ